MTDVLAYIIIFIGGGIIFTVGLMAGQRIERQRIFNEEDIGAEGVNPLVTYKDLKRVYKQIKWRIDD